MSAVGNFASNSLNLRGKQVEIASQIWKFLSELREKENEARRRLDAVNENKEKSEMEVTEKQRKEQTAPLTNVPKCEKDDSEDTISKDKLSLKRVRKTAKKILRKGKSSMKLKHLHTKLCETLSVDKSLQKKLKKMLKSDLAADNSKFKMDGKMISLVKV